MMNAGLSDLDYTTGVANSKSAARFIEPMLWSPLALCPKGRTIPLKSNLTHTEHWESSPAGAVRLRSRNDKDFNSRYPVITKFLAALPDKTVVDGETVALDFAGRPSFYAVQNFGSAGAIILYYIFDVLVLAGRDVMAELLRKRRELR